MGAISYLNASGASLHVSLTDREIDVVASALGVRTYKGIAKTLGLSPKTVENYLGNVYAKLEVNSRDGLVDRIRETGFEEKFRRHYLYLQKEDLIRTFLAEHAHAVGRRKITCHLVSSYGSGKAAEKLGVRLKRAGLYCKQIIVGNKDDILALHNSTPPSEGNVYVYIKEGKLKSLANKSARFNPFEVVLGAEDETQDFISVLKRLSVGVDFRGVLTKLEKDLQALRGEKLEVEKSAGFFFSARIIRYFLFALLLSLAGVWSWFEMAMPGMVCAPHIAYGVLESYLPRADKLDFIKTKMEKTDANRNQVIAIVGLGGTGKTSIAELYARSRISQIWYKPKIVWTIDCSNYESQLLDLEVLAQKIVENTEGSNEKSRVELKLIRNIDDPKRRRQSLIQFVHHELRCAGPWVLIFDGVSTAATIVDLLPIDKHECGGGEILITTRDHSVGDLDVVSDVLPIEALTEEECFDILRRQGRVQQITPLVKKAFFEKVPSFPLDYMAAARYMKLMNITPEIYLKRLQRETFPFDTLQKSALSSHSYKQTRYSIVSLSLASVLKKNVSAHQKLLVLISLVDHQNIPREWLNKLVGDTTADEFLVDLQRFSLCTFDSMYVNFHKSIHNVLQHYVRAECENYRTDAPLVIKLLVEDNPFVKFYINLQDLRPLVSHGPVLINHLSLRQMDKAFAELCIAVGQSLAAVGQKIEAEKLLAHALNYYEQAGNPTDKIKTYLVFSYIGFVRGDFNIAEAYLDRAASTAKKHNLKSFDGTIHLRKGMIARERGKFKLAEDHLRKAEPLLRDVNNRDYNTALSFLEGIDLVYERFEKALELTQMQFAEAVKKGVGHKAPWEASQLFYLLTKLKRYDEARAHYEAYLAPNKQTAAAFLVSSGQAYFTGLGLLNLGRESEALTLLERCLEILTKMSHNTSSALLRPLMSLAEFYISRERLDEANLAMMRIRHILVSDKKKPHYWVRYYLARAKYLKARRSYIFDHQKREAILRRVVKNLERAKQQADELYPHDTPVYKRILNDINKTAH